MSNEMLPGSEVHEIVCDMSTAECFWDGMVPLEVGSRIKYSYFGIEYELVIPAEVLGAGVEDEVKPQS